MFTLKENVWEQNFQTESLEPITASSLVPFHVKANIF